MPSKGVNKPPQVPKVRKVAPPGRLKPPPKLEQPPKLDETSVSPGNRHKVSRDKTHFQSPYLHNLNQAPSKEERDRQERLREERELLQERQLMKQRQDEIDKKIQEIRNQSEEINPFEEGEQARSFLPNLISDLRDIGQSPLSNNISNYYQNHPLHKFFKEQFAVSEDDVLDVALNLLKH